MTAMRMSMAGLPEGTGKAHPGGFPRPGHLSGLHDVGEVPVREDPTAERGATAPHHPRPGLEAFPGRPAPPHTHCSPWQVERAAKEWGFPRSRPW